MEEIFEEYGLGFLSIVAITFGLAIIFKSYTDEGVICQMVTDYFVTLCGVS